MATIEATIRALSQRGEDALVILHEKPDASKREKWFHSLFYEELLTPPVLKVRFKTETVGDNKILRALKHAGLDLRRDAVERMSSSFPSVLVKYEEELARLDCEEDRDYEVKFDGR